LRSAVCGSSMASSVMCLCVCCAVLLCACAVLCRVLQVIVLLNTCGSYFSKGAAKRRLDRFLTFLQVRDAQHTQH